MCILVECLDRDMFLIDKKDTKKEINDRMVDEFIDALSYYDEEEANRVSACREQDVIECEYGEIDKTLGLAWLNIKYNYDWTIFEI